MKIRRSAVLALSLTLVMMFSALTVNAESQTFEGHSTFNGSKIVSDFNSGQVAEAVTNLQPGDDVTFTVNYTNKYDGDTDWYLENSVVKTLEKTQGSNASGGGYTYELTHVDSNGVSQTLFSNERVGGEYVTPNKREGLEQATNALEDWFYLEKLAPDKSGKVILKVAFEGETQANDYMDTNGELDLRFAVEIPTSGGTRIINPGDNTMLKLWTAILLLSAVLLFILAAFSRRRDRRAAGAEEGGDQ